jgi:hypothetical protein
VFLVQPHFSMKLERKNWIVTCTWQVRKVHKALGILLNGKKSADKLPIQVTISFQTEAGQTKNKKGQNSPMKR